MSNTPLIFVIDIDGCLIGNITPQIMLYELITELKANNVKINMNMSHFNTKLKSCIIRPYFATFINNIKQHHPTAEFFIYTASQNKWANFLIKQVEKVLNIKFNRPLFTRNECVIIDNECKKDLNIIKPTIYKALKKKYGNITIQNRILMIDNTNVFNKLDQQSLLLCPTYSNYTVENIPIVINEELYNKNLSIINSVIHRYINMTYLPKNYLEFQELFYRYYVDQINSCKNTTDRFWYNLTKLIIKKNIRYFGPKTVSYIQKKMDKIGRIKP